MIRYFIPIAINTHIDCLNNSKCSVRCIFKATERSLESVTFSIFCYLGMQPALHGCADLAESTSDDHSSLCKVIQVGMGVC